MIHLARILSNRTAFGYMQLISDQNAKSSRARIKNRVPINVSGTLGALEQTVNF